jgi:replication factor A1
MNKIAELRPFQKRVELNVKVLDKKEVREVTSKLDNSNHKVTEAVVGDDSGVILLTLWDDMIDKVEVNKSYKINNAYTSLFKNTLRLNIGRYGELKDAEQEVTEVNEANNVSEKEFEPRRRFRNNRFNHRKDSASTEKEEESTQTENEKKEEQETETKPEEEAKETKEKNEESEPTESDQQKEETEAKEETQQQ